MSSSKFYIWGGGRWREVNTASGEVAGWSRRPHFVFARRGRLRVAARRRVLAALQAHAANLHSSVELGPRLSVLRNEPAPAATSRAVPSSQPAHCAHHHCCVYSHGLHNDNFGKCNHNGALITKSCSTRNELDGLLASHGASLASGLHAGEGRAARAGGEPHAGAERVARAVRGPHAWAERAARAGGGPRATADAAVQHSPADRALSINLDAITFPPHERTASTRVSHEHRPHVMPLRNLLEIRSSLTRRRRSVLSDSDDSERHFKPASERRRGQGDERPHKTPSKSKKSATGKARKKRGADSQSGSGKELTVSEADVRALRGLVARTRSDALARFDADDDYKRLLFYAINPLVHVERCPLTERKLRERFAARLGLAPASPSPAPSPAPERRALRSTADKGRAAGHGERSADEPDSDDELELFQNSRGVGGSSNRNWSNSRKNAIDVASLRNSYKNKRWGTCDENESAKNRNSPRLRARAENDSSRRSATFKKPEILRRIDENRNSNLENGTFDDNKRRSLRRSTLAQSERVAEHSKSADELEPRPRRAPRRQSSTHKDTTDSSDGDDTRSSSEGRAVQLAALGEAERGARRRRDSDEERETLGDSGRGSEPADERRTSRRRSEPEKRDIGSRRKSSRASVSAIAKKYHQRSTSEEKHLERSRSAREGGGARATEPPVEPAPRDGGAGPELTHTISKRASSGKAKEYSNLEDHAIVAWVSSGARARRVNGNALWRELQEQYPRLAGQGRSWHSLRNRYLRYILPALGALHLPPATASRLRAAAAAGSLKRRGAAGEGRRNSIFDRSEVSAASARGPRPRPARSPTPTSTPKPTPEPAPAPEHLVLRKRPEVAGAAAARQEPAEEQGPAARRAPGRGAPDAEGGGGEGRRERARRVRELFNPKLVL